VKARVVVDERKYDVTPGAQREVAPITKAQQATTNRTKVHTLMNNVRETTAC
jgi:hypothetical protein